MERRVFESGRFTIPSFFRTQLDMNYCDLVYLRLQGHKIIASKREDEGCVARIISHIGGLVIPREFMEELSIIVGSRVNVTIEGGNLVITKSELSCLFCGSYKNIEIIKGVRICQPCIDEIKNSPSSEAS